MTQGSTLSFAAWDHAVAFASSPTIAAIWPAAARPMIALMPRLVPPVGVR